MSISIFHLSDLHFKNDVENRFRLKALLDDIKERTRSNVSYTVFTGDLVYSGDDDNFEILFDLLIGPLTELGHEVFIVPGNHDVQRSSTDSSYSERVLADRGSSYLFGGGRNIISTHPHVDFDSLAKYRDLEDVLGPYEYKNIWGYSATRKSVSFIGINSSWLCCKRPLNQTDRGLLRAEPAVLSEILLRLPADTMKIALMHHPLDWLEEGTRSAVNDLLIENADLVLFGHVHSKDIISFEKGNKNSLFLQAPPLRADWSKGTNGYSVIHANTDHKRFQIDFRSYSKTRREFVLGEDFAPNGQLFPRIVDREFYVNSPLPSNLIQKYLDSSPFDFQDWYRNNIRAKSKTSGAFIIPKVHLITETDEGQVFGPARPLDEVMLETKRDQFFVAPLDAGSTTAAYLAFKRLSEAFEDHFQIPAYFDAAEDKINRATILRAINRTTLVRYTRSEAEQLVDDGSVVVVVDGLCIGDVEQFNLFRETANQYFPKVRFIFFISTERKGVVPSGVGGIKLSAVEDEVHEFAQLAVADIRSMIELRMPDLNEDVREGLVRQVVESFQQMDEPIFASTVAVVIETLSQDLEFRPINKARLIERYVECLLGRFDIEDVREGTFASSDKIDFLSFFARQLLERERGGFSEVEWNGVEQVYKKKYIIELPDNLLVEFVEKGLLTLSNGEITFRGDHLFSFFIARQMKADVSFAASLTGGDGLFKYHREITVYGELEGTSISAVLNELYDAVESIQSGLLDAYGKENIDLTNEWEQSKLEAKNSSGEQSLGKAAEDLENTAPTAEDADRSDDAELAKIQRRRGVSARENVRQMEAKLLVSLRLYSNLLKNSLHLEGDQKLKHLKKLYEAAELWVGFICACREYVGRYPITIVGGVCIINRAAFSASGKSLESFKFDAPNSMGTMLASIMRNPQLLPAIRKALPDLSPMSALFARQTLLGAPSDANLSSYISSLTMEEDVDLVTCSLRTLRTKYLSAGRNKKNKVFLESVLHKLHESSAISINIDLQKMKKARLVQDLKQMSESNEQ